MDIDWARAKQFTDTLREAANVNPKSPNFPRDPYPTNDEVSSREATGVVTVTTDAAVTPLTSMLSNRTVRPEE